MRAASAHRIDQWRNETARRQREDTVARLAVPDSEPVSGVDDTLVLLLLCCHPSLTPASQLALTLRAVGGLTTAEIARAFLVPEATISPRSTARRRRSRQAARNSGRPALTIRPSG